MTTTGHFDYAALQLEALRGVVRTVLTKIAKSGLPGEHHFFVAFNTLAPGVTISKRLLAKYPQEMTIVLQHRFWDLMVLEDRFEVKLSFDGIPERLVVPYKAIRVFFDPSVPYGLQFEGATDDDALAAVDDALASVDDGVRVSGRSVGRTDSSKNEAVSLDKRRTPKKPRVVADDTPDDDAAGNEDVAAKPAAKRGSKAGTETGTSKPAAKPAAAGASVPAVTGPVAVPSDADNDSKVVSLDKFRKK